MSLHLSRRRLLGMAAGLPLAACRTGESGTQAIAKAAPEARAVARVVAATPTMEGAGVKIARALGSRALPMADPFLLLDEIRSNDPRDYEAGFPQHPHRGFETVTYMIDGVMEHADSIGNRGLLQGGSLQWMTAGRGIVHSEMPRQKAGAFWGFQLWVNLPRRLKMTQPRYQDLAPGRVPEIGASVKTRVLAGKHDGASGPVDGVATAPTMLDVTLAPGDSFVHELPVMHTAIVYVIRGAAQVGPSRTPVAERELAVLGSGATVLARAEGERARLLLIAAEPIGEPVARRGPFVMNTQDELDRAFDDYRNGRLVGGG